MSLRSEFTRCDFHYDFRIKTVSGSSLATGGGPMSYLCYLCLFAHSGVQQISRCVFVLFSSSFVLYVASFSGLSIYSLPLGIFYRVFAIKETSTQTVKIV